MAAKFTLFPILLTANFYNFKFGKLSKNYNNDSRYSNTNGSTCFENSLLCLWNIFFLISQNFVLRKMMRLPIAGVDWHSARLDSTSAESLAKNGPKLSFINIMWRLVKQLCGAGAKIFSLRPEPNYIRSTAVHTFWPRNRYNSNISHKHSWQLEISYS